MLLTGAQGMLAYDVCACAPDEYFIHKTDIAELDITDIDAVRTFCAEIAPDIILNCAAYTAVDAAETDSDTAYAVNETGPRILATVAKERGIPLVHISTDFVFEGDGTHPLREDDVCAPRGVYAQSKRAGEVAIEKSGAEWLTVRTSWLYGVHGKNFPATILGLARERDELTVVADQIGSPTYTEHLARALWELITCKAREYVHFCNSGTCSWYEFACAVIDIAQEEGLFPSEKKVTILPVPSSAYPRPAPRPAYSVMDTSLYTRHVGHPPPAWRDGLRAFIQETIKHTK